ncbi:MAG: M20 family metallopeptidase [Anaerolineae bacterium]
MQQRKAKAVGQIETVRDGLFDLSRKIHGNPELPYEEFQAAFWLSQFLEARGFEVEREVGGLPTAFVATISGESLGPTIAFLAEYDALPEVGHGCGHNLIGVGAVGAALGISALMPELAGTIQVIGTPAEEVEGTPGKIRLLEAGILSGVDVCLMFHPWTETSVALRDLGYMILDVTFRGKSAHAAADPWNGLNALDGVVLAYNGVSTLRQQMKPTARLHCIVTRGGDSVNTIPELASVRLMIRSPEGRYLEELCAKVENYVEGAALATGTKVDIQKIAHVQNSRFNATLYEVVERNMAALGQNLGQLRLWAASSDFGNVSQTLPALYILVKTHEPGMNWHSRAVAQGAISEQAHAGMLLAAKCMALSAIDLFSEPDLLKRAAKDFEGAQIFKQGVHLDLSQS